jgi:hypothetical protein
MLRLDSGRVLVFSLSAEGKLTLIKEISTQGSLPDSIKWQVPSPSSAQRHQHQSFVVI